MHLTFVGIPSAAKRIARTLVAAMLVSPGLGAAADEGPASNVYMTGTDVRIDRAIDGDLVAATGRIHVDQAVSGDAALGGGIARCPGGDRRGPAPRPRSTIAKKV